MASFRSWLRVFFLLDKRPSRFVKHLRRARKWRAKHPGTPCHTCGYDLGKDQSLATCPECGNTINWNPEWYEDGYLQLRGLVINAYVQPILFVIVNSIIFVISFSGIFLAGYDPSYAGLVRIGGFSILIIAVFWVNRKPLWRRYLDPFAFTRQYSHQIRRWKFWCKPYIVSTVVVFCLLAIVSAGVWLGIEWMLDWLG
jgi:hypothetical protein